MARLIAVMAGRDNVSAVRASILLSDQMLARGLQPGGLA